MFDCRHVVEHLSDVLAVVVGWLVGLEQDQIRHGRLCSLDPAGQHGFPADERTGQQAWIGQRATSAGKFAEGTVGLREQADQGPVEVERRWQRRWDEGEVVALGPYDVARLLGSEGVTPHRYPPTVPMSL